jgi:hypothetical protein
MLHPTTKTEYAAMMPKNGHLIVKGSRRHAYHPSACYGVVRQLRFQFSFFCFICSSSEVESYRAFWIASSGSAPVGGPGLTCYSYILCGVHYMSGFGVHTPRLMGCVTAPGPVLSLLVCVGLVSGVGVIVGGTGFDFKPKSSALQR